MLSSTTAKSNQAPIFVVGVPRSGTTLLAAMLAAHSRLSCGPESHFFNQTPSRDFEALCHPRPWPLPALEYLDSINILGKTVTATYGISREDIDRYLRTRSPSVPAILESLTEQYMRQVGKQRWIEKTPGHCLCVQTIRQYFPTSPIIRIVRDPRDVALSLQKQSWGPTSFIESIWKWRAFEALCGDFFRTDPYAFTLRYEDLLVSPEAKLREVCAAIGETFELGMLNTSQSVLHVNKTNAACQVKAGTPVDASRIEAWKQCLTDGDNRLFEALLGNHLRTYGYSCRDDFEGFLRVYPASQSRHYWHVLEGFVSRGFRLWSKDPRETPTISVYLGQPDSEGWLHGDRLTRLLKAAALSLDLWRSRVSGRRVCWFTEGARKTSGLCARLLYLGLNRVSTSSGMPEGTTR
jgi:hypothetical protein